jgi:zinc transport system permease protein
MGMFEYTFMQRAFFVGILLAIIIPCIGIIVVLRRLSMIGDALSHVSLAGVTAGLIMGINPIVGSVVACVFAALSVEAIRKKIPQYGEVTIAIIMSAGVGLAGILSDFVKGSANFNSFLFGSIVAISPFEMWLVAAIACGVLLTFILLYKELFFIAFDERGARLAGVPVNSINVIFTIMTAVTISVAARTVGTLVVSSMMVIPVACAIQLGKSFKQALLLAISFDVLFTVIGLTLAYYAGLKPGGTIVLTGVFFLIMILFGKKLS